MTSEKLTIKGSHATAAKLHIINECQEAACDLESELESLSYLFRHLDGCDDFEQRLYGVGLLLHQMSKRVAKLNFELGRVKG